MLLPPDERAWLQLIQATGSGGEARTPEAERRADARILDVFQSTASVRADMQGWIDYMHLARMDDGRWVIVNVLWEQRNRSAAGPTPTRP